MKRLWTFVVLAVVFQAIALVAVHVRQVSWLLEVIVAFIVLYLLWLALNGWQRQSRIDLPPSMGGTVVRKRHWTLF
ncbi:MAG: hypothetical protein K6T83_14195 [Alicyclobacillus sp.]|nr:hypothetical protein [Alicyclobacillus sp.]